MTDCAETRQNLHLYVGGELEPTQASTAKRHLAACPPCRAALEEAERARELYLGAAVDADAEPLDLWPGIRSRLVSEGRLDGVASTRARSAESSDPRAARTQERVGSNAGARTVLASSPRFASGWVWAGIAAAAAAVWLALPLLRAEPVPLGSPIATPEKPLPTFVREPADAVAGNVLQLRPVLQGEESLIERAWRERLELEATGVESLPQLEFQGTNEVVNTRQLRQLR